MGKKKKKHQPSTNNDIIADNMKPNCLSRECMHPDTVDGKMQFKEAGTYCFVTSFEWKKKKIKQSISCIPKKNNMLNGKENKYYN